MATTTWTAAPGGVYKNRFLSDRLLMQAVGATKLMPLTTVPDQDFSSHQGEYINLMRVNELTDPATSKLTESTRIPISNITWGSRQIQLFEWGGGLRVTNFARQLGAFHQDNVFQGLLQRQMERAMDTAVARDGIFTTDAKLIATPTSGTAITFDTDGTVSTAAASGMTFDHFGIIADYLAGNIHCPPFVGEDYIFVTARLNTRAIKRDTLWQAIHLYLQKGDLFFRGEVGKAENIRVMEVHREDAIANSSGTTGLIAEGAFLGDQAIARVEIVTPEVVFDPNFQSDFGRIQAAAWWGILSFASWYDVSTDGFCRIIKWLST